jgi:hypothetical protein
MTKNVRTISLAVCLILYITVTEFYRDWYVENTTTLIRITLTGFVFSYVILMIRIKKRVKL